MNTKKVRIECCGCRKTMGYKVFSWKSEEIKEPVTHSICPACMVKLYPELFSKAEIEKITSGN